MRLEAARFEAMRLEAARFWATRLDAARFWATVRGGLGWMIVS
jgi:hypothetical protein